MPTWDNRFPFLGTSGRKQLQRRYAACELPMARGLEVSPEQLREAKLLGCGNLGSGYRVPGLPADRCVLDVTSDNPKAYVVHLLLSWGDSRSRTESFATVGDGSSAPAQSRRGCGRSSSAVRLPAKLSLLKGAAPSGGSGLRVARGSYGKRRHRRTQ